MMYKTIASALAGVLMAGSLGEMKVQAASKQLAIFAADMSTSAAIAIDRHIAKQAGNYVQSVVGRLNTGDRVKILSLGTAGSASRQIVISAVLGVKRRNRPRRIAAVLAKTIRALPSLVETGKINLQPRTNIIGFLEAIAPSLDCKNTRTRLVLFSDGIEWSTLVNGNDLLSGKASLPSPSSAFLKGCVIELRGVGQQNSKLVTDSAWFPILRSQWMAYFKAAGATEIKITAESGEF